MIRKSIHKVSSQQITRLRFIGLLIYEKVETVV